MKTGLRAHIVEFCRTRLPVFLVAMAFCGGLCLRHDLQSREAVRESTERVLHRLAAEGEAAALGQGSPALGWLRLYPEIARAELIDADGNQFGSYRAEDQGGSPSLFPASMKRGRTEARLEAMLPGWVASGRDLPIIGFSLLLLLILLSGTAPRAPTTVQDPLTGEVASEVAPDAAPAAGKPRLVLELDAAMKIARVSKGISSYGYSSEELIGTPVEAFVQAFHPSRSRSMLGVSDSWGGRLDSLVTATSLQNASGHLEKVVLTVEEPTDVQDLRARNSRLQSLVNSICDNARDAVLFMDPGANVVYANRSFDEAAGLPPVLGGDLVSRLSPEDRLRFVDALQAALEGAPAEGMEVRLERQGEPIILEGSLHAMRSPDSGTPLAMGIFRDVTEARRLNAELKESRERASHSQKIEALGRLAGGVAHDFNNLLTTMMLNLDALASSPGLPDRDRPHVDEIALAARKAADISRQLLVYSRKKPAELCRVSCHAVVEDTRRLTESVRSGGRLETRLEADVDQVSVEGGQLDQVLLNLVINAKDAAGPEGLVQVLTENRTLLRDNPYRLAPGAYLVLSVRDDGGGIPLELQAKIFEPYFTTKDVGKGTGLGLSTVAAIVEKAGGHLALTSVSGCTTFEVLLPVAAESAPSPAPSPAVVTSTAQKREVLLVEDEPAIRALVQRLLERRGYRVTSLSNGPAAKEILSAGRQFDVLITDLKLPGISGDEVATAYHRTHPRGAILFISGFPGDTLGNTEIRDCSRFLAKPFSPEQLFGSLDDLLSRTAAAAG